MTEPSGAGNTGVNLTGARLGAKAADALAEAGRCIVAPGLSKDELSSIEAGYGFEFSDDHRAFLAAGLPLDRPIASDLRHPSRPSWPDWRAGDQEHLQAMLDWPVEGVLFDVEENDYWYETWGSRPEVMEEALAMARDKLSEVPKMVPVVGHRYLPAGRGTWGHPVMSMYQTDIIYYGADLLQFVGGKVEPQHCPSGAVPFWRDLAS